MPGIRKQSRVVRASEPAAWFRFLNAYRDGKITVDDLENMLRKACEREQFRDSKRSEAIVEDSSDVSTPKKTTTCKSTDFLEDGTPFEDDIKSASRPTTTEGSSTAIKRIQHPRLGWREAGTALMQEVVQREHARTLAHSDPPSVARSLDKIKV